MGRTRIINDPTYLVPLLQCFGSKKDKKVFDLLFDKWMTINEIDSFLKESSINSINHLKKAGLLESQWRVPNPGEKPLKEYRISYSNIQVNFHCSFEDLSDIILLSLKSDDEIQLELKNLESLVCSGITSISKLTRELNLKPLYIFALSRRSEILSVMGQRLKIVEHNEEKEYES